MIIYFAGAIRGGRADQALYLQIIEELRGYGTVLTEHIGDAALTQSGEEQSDAFIHDRDLDWLRSADVLVAEVTTPSLGVGYEIGRCIEWGKARDLPLPSGRGPALVRDDRRLQRCHRAGVPNHRRRHRDSAGRVRRTNERPGLMSRPSNDDRQT